MLLTLVLFITNEQRVMAIYNVSNDNDILTVITDAHCRCSQYLQINRKNSWHLKNRTTKTTFCFWLYVYNNCIQQYAKLGSCDNCCGLSPVTLPLNSVSKLHCHFTPELSRIRMNLGSKKRFGLVCLSSIFHLLLLERGLDTNSEYTSPQFLETRDS